MKTSNFYVLFFLIGIHFLTEGARAETIIAEKSYQEATAKIELDCTALTFEVTGRLSGGSISAYSVYKNAIVNDDGAGNVSITPGNEVLMDADGFVFSDTVVRTYSIDNPNDTYCFIFGQRSFGHGYYDVSVEASCNSSSSSQTVAIEQPARVNLNSKMIPVKILLEPTGILPEDVDISSIEFGDPELSGTASPSGYRYQENDLMLFIRTSDLMDNAAVDEYSTEALLTGTTYDGISFSGSSPFGINGDKGKGPKNKGPKDKK